MWVDIQLPRQNIERLLEEGLVGHFGRPLFVKKFSRLAYSNGVFSET
jgi:hypothetical protein